MPQITPATRTVDVDRKIIEISGKLYAEPPKGRKRRRTIYPSRTPPGIRPGGQGRRPYPGGPAPSRKPGPTRMG